MSEDTVLSNVTPIHGRMTADQYDKERARLRGLYGDSRKEAGARYEQALAKLFHLSGWTLQELADREKRGKTHISRLMIFGRFLGFIDLSPTGNKPENGESNVPFGLTERRFRGFWERTTDDAAAGSSGGNERFRFKQVLKLMDEDAAVPKIKTNTRELGKSIAAHFADGKWHDIAVITKRLDAPIEDVQSVLENIRAYRSFSCSGEKKEVAKTWHYRLFPLERQISTVEIAEKLAEPLKVLTEQGRANMATMSPQTVAYWTAIIKQQVTEWTGRPPKK